MYLLINGIILLFTQDKIQREAAFFLNEFWWHITLKNDTIWLKWSYKNPTYLISTVINAEYSILTNIKVNVLKVYVTKDVFFNSICYSP